MLNLVKLKLKKSKKFSDKKHIYLLNKKFFPSFTREWRNSIYVYNKNVLNLTPSTSNNVIKIIKSYFNFFNKNLERKIRMKRLLLRFRRLTSNKIYSNKGTFKHTNNKVIISFNIFNRQRYNYIKIINNNLKKIVRKKNFIKGLKNMKKNVSKIKKYAKDRFIIANKLNKWRSNLCLISLSKYMNNFFKRLKKRSLKKLRLNYYYKQLLYINKSKLNYTYLQYLKKHIEHMYNKNVEFNLINLNKFYLNSDIMSESITLKLKKNRRKIVRLLNKIEFKIKIRRKTLHWYKSAKIRKNLIIKRNFTNTVYLRKFIIQNLKHKYISGFRLEAKGRLTKRYTASRSLFKLRYKGNLLNVDSSFKGLSSVLLKGNLKSNLQHTKLNSKTRIGSFGIKGWISSN